MTTPDFEEWLSRQDFPVEETLDKERFLAMLEEQFGIHGGSLDVAERWFTERYDILPQVGISPFDWRGTTRYAIGGLRGAFGLERALEIGIDRAKMRGLWEVHEWLDKMRELIFS